MRRRWLAVLAFGLAAGCSGGEEHTTVPSNATYSLEIAMERLLAADLRVAIEHFPPQPAGVGLEGYQVGIQSPRSPARVPKGTVVTVRIWSSPIPSPGFLARHPPTVEVPKLVGHRYPEAVARIPDGLWLEVGHVPPLTPEASRDGFAAFVVERQTPAPGEVVLYGRGHAPGGGCRPSTVRIDLELADH